MDLEINADQSIEKGAVNRYILSGDLIAGRVTTTVSADSSETESLHYYHLDHLNSTKMVTDESGAVEVSYTYRAFGEQLKRLDAELNETEDLAKYSYGGKELDGDSNLYYFNARFYDATTGRFINVDPVQDGSNWYIYCSNSPLNMVDPTGLDDDKITADYVDLGEDGTAEFGYDVSDGNGGFKTKWENLDVGQELTSSMKVRTSGDAFVEINMFDQTNLQISDNTEFNLSDIPKLTREGEEAYNKTLANFTDGAIGTGLGALAGFGVNKAMQSNPYTAAFSKTPLAKYVVGSVGAAVGIGYSGLSNEIGDLTGKNIGNHVVSNTFGKYIFQKLMNFSTAFNRVESEKRNTQLNGSHSGIDG